MCYSISQAKRRAFIAALKEDVSAEEAERLYNEWQESQKDESYEDSESPMAFLNGFQHPKLFTLIKTSKLDATRFIWGLIPEWVKNTEQAFSIWNKTLNARGESIFEKPAFKMSALDKRCLIFVNGFFEYHHYKGKTFPHFIRHKDNEKPLAFGGLWSEWEDHQTGQVYQSASIVTTQANDLMEGIHNNPKANGARMPLIIEPNNFDQWLTADKRADIDVLIKPLASEKLHAHTVRRLIGDKGIGDVLEATEAYDYQELNKQGELF